MKNNKIIKFLLIIFIFVFVSFFLYYYFLNGNKNGTGGDTISDISNSNENIIPLEMKDEVRITINEKDYILKLENNKTVSDLLSITPLNVVMKDLNNNEKYVYLDSTLYEDGNYTGIIKKGDVMLYQDNCLVIFYKEFKTNYYYTKIGHIDNLPDFDYKNINVIIG